MGVRPNKHISLMRRSAEIHWERTSHRLCAERWVEHVRHALSRQGDQ